MQQIRKLTPNDFGKYKGVFESLGIEQSSDVDDGYEVIIDNQKYIIFPLGNLVICFKNVKGNFIRNTIQMDDNANLISFNHNGKRVLVNPLGIDVLDSEQNQQSLYLVKDRKEATSGTVSYLQYNSANDMSLNLRYRHNAIRNERELYPYHTDDPFYVTFKQRASKNSFWNFGRSYCQFNFDVWSNKIDYDIATIKEYGLGAALSKGTVSLQQKLSFSKFYRVLLQVGDNVTVTGYPFARQYNEEDIYEMINKAGFGRSIPEWLINLYNNSEILASEWQKLLDCCFKEEKVLIK